MNDLLRQALRIRYAKLRFTIVFCENTRLPKDKPSAIRGGIGEMLLRANCIRNRNCELCDFQEECVVQRTMYTHFKEKPAFVTTGESVGYVLECENIQEVFKRGETLDFSLLLFGRNLVYFSQYIQAVCALGREGLGKNRARFSLVEVANSDGDTILSGNRIDMAYYRIRRLDDYVKEQQRLRGDRPFCRLVFHTPLTLKYHGEFLKEFQIDAILSGIRRRIYMLDCFEEIQREEWMKQELPRVGTGGQRAYLCSMERYSSRKDCRMILRGLVGSICLTDVPKEAKALLLAGELIHVGKNTSFGFGRYEILGESV